MFILGCEKQKEEPKFEHRLFLQPAVHKRKPKTCSHCVSWQAGTFLKEMCQE